MKLTIVGPGLMPIPPKGWGAVEILIWDMKCAYEELGHEVQIVNTQDADEILKQITKFNPDFVHIEYDGFRRGVHNLVDLLKMKITIGFRSQSESMPNSSNFFLVILFLVSKNSS